MRNKETSVSNKDNTSNFLLKNYNKYILKIMYYTPAAAGRNRTYQ